MVLFFGFCFAAFFFLTTIVHYLQIRIDTVRSFPPGQEQSLEELLLAIRWALPVTIYASLLFGLSYSVRRQVFAPLSILCLIILSAALSFAVVNTADQLGRTPGPVKPAKDLGGPGLILRQADNAVVLLRDPAETWGSRVAAIPGRPLIFQEIPLGPNNSVLSLPPAPFRTDTSWLLQGLIIDFSLTGRQFVLRFAEGPRIFLLYIAALLFLLVSMRFILNLTNWPLANLFVGALAFRGILALDIFLNTGEIQGTLGSFVGDVVPPVFITPLLFFFLGLLACLYSGLHFLAVRKDSDEDY
jgi:hypothetical protein